MKRRLPAFALLAMFSALAAPPAAAGAPPDQILPPEELVLPVLGRMPEVQAATAARARAEADGRLRRVGPHETTLTMIPQRRHVEGGPTFNAWEADLSRPVRWPHKARLDREIGSAGLEAAQLALADTYHDGARRLLAQWSDWQRARLVSAQQHSQVATWERDHHAIARRVELGDAAERDLIAATAALAQARAATLQAEANVQVAESILRATFPGLPLPDQVALGNAPPALVGSDRHWSDLIVEHSHEIGIAAALAQQREAEAQRVRAERLPDPTVGVRVIDDPGRERSAGLIVSIPFGMRQRSAQAAAAGADASAAQAQLASVRRDIARSALDVVARARATRAIWDSRHDALEAARSSSSKTARAYALGESDLAELLVARRAELEAKLAERSALVDAIEAVALVRIDAHDLWHYHIDEPGGPGHADGDALPAGT